jgi:hypothetical protein
MENELTQKNEVENSQPENLLHGESAIISGPVETIAGQTDLPSRQFGLFTADEILKLPTPKFKYLVDPLIRHVDVGAIVGKPGAGKSLLANQLALEIAAGSTTFLGLPLVAKHKRVLFVSTEDGLFAIQERLQTQSINVAGFDRNGLCYLILDDDTSIKKLLSSIRQFITKDPVDLIIVDAFGDIVEAPDGNNNILMRNTVSPFANLAMQHETVVLFTHHVNKAGYDKPPSQVHIQGGSGFGQKIRIAIQLDSKEDSRRNLLVLKGNYCGEEYKKNGIELSFDEQRLWFTPTGNKVSSSSQVKVDIPKVKQHKFDFVMGLKKVLAKKPLRFSQLVSVLIQESGTSESTVRREIDAKVKSGLLRHDGKLYSVITEPDTSPDEDTCNEVSTQAA